MDDLKVAVITTGHGYDVPNFHRLFRSLEGLDCYVQSLEDLLGSGKARAEYDVLCFFHMPPGEPAPKGRGWQGRVRSAMESIGKMDQGIVVLHHGILAWLDWPFWGELVGMSDRTFDDFHHDETMRIDIADGDHPITVGLEAWDIVDETYEMSEPDAADNRMLLTVDHPQSMKAVAWTRTHGKARVFCYQLGHDNIAWENEGFRTVLAQGIRWSAGRI
jgi:hypothetical protein